MKFNKKGVGLVVSNMMATFFVIFILALYFVFIVLGSFTTGEIESVIESEDKVVAYNYYPTLVNFLNTEVGYELNGKNEVLILDIIRDHSETENHDDILNEKVKELFSKLEYCYYDDGDVRSVRFILFLSNGDKWDNIPFYDQWEVISFDMQQDYLNVLAILIYPNQNI
jgi:hypothetical protein